VKGSISVVVNTSNICVLPSMHMAMKILCSPRLIAARALIPLAVFRKVENALKLKCDSGKWTCIVLSYFYDSSAGNTLSDNHRVARTNIS